MKVLSLLLNGLYDGLIAYGADFWCIPAEDACDEH